MKGESSFSNHGLPDFRYWAQMTLASRNLARIIWIHVKEREGEQAKDDLIAKLSILSLQGSDVKNVYQRYPRFRRCHKIPPSSATRVRLPRSTTSHPESLDSRQTSIPRGWSSTSEAVQLATSSRSIPGRPRDHVRSIQSTPQGTYLSRQSSVRDPQLYQCLYSDRHCEWDDECPDHASSSYDCND